MKPRTKTLPRSPAAGPAGGTPVPEVASAIAARGGASRQLRIIAGSWRGRRWRFPPTGMRPTPDRVRETLFNWLQGRIAGRRCLDLFAGSGALGLEALSRGAASVVFVEQQRPAAQALRELLGQWQATGARVEQGDALALLAQRPDVPFDLVYVDPPYDAGLYAPVAARLAQAGWLATGALVYVEHARAAPPAAFCAADSGWSAWRSGQAGEVGYHLFSRTQPS